MITTQTQDLKPRQVRHGQSKTKLYQVWTAMNARCSNPRHKNYKDYGGRQIGVCDEWRHSFKDFQEWATSHGYADSLTLDRAENDEGYSSQNCRWISRREQSRNRRNNVHILFDGRVQILADWMREFGFSYGSVRHWTKKGMSLPEIVERFKIRKSGMAA